jgi:aerobic-type carbon monoxide dehydrogenase small subunit (CoxS/CutS family)
MSEPTIDVTLTINGNQVTRRGIPADMRLLELLHEELGLSGTKLGCGIAVCRACTVALERVPGAAPVPILACSTLVSQVDGQSIRTVEGLASAKGLDPLQKAVLDAFAFQCGYCTPGFLMAAHVMVERLKKAPVPRDRVDETIDQACGSHICRCTGYVRYWEALRKVVLDTPHLVKD